MAVRENDWSAMPGGLLRSILACTREFASPMAGYLALHPVMYPIVSMQKSLVSWNTSFFTLPWLEVVSNTTNLFCAG